MSRSDSSFSFAVEAQAHVQLKSFNGEGRSSKASQEDEAARFATVTSTGSSRSAPSLTVLSVGHSFWQVVAI
jgi:hypothetical protein